VAAVCALGGGAAAWLCRSAQGPLPAVPPPSGEAARSSEALRWGQRVARLEVGPTGVAWDPRGERIAIEQMMADGSSRGTGIYSTSGWTAITQLPVRRPSWSPDGASLAGVDSEGSLRIYKAADFLVSETYKLGINMIGWDGATPVVYTGELVRVEAGAGRAIDRCVDGCLPVRWSPSVSRAVVTRTRGNDREAVVLDLRDGRTLAALGPIIGDAIWAAQAPVVAWQTTTALGVWGEGADAVTIDLRSMPKAVSPRGSLVLCRTSEGQWSLLHVGDKSVIPVSVPSELDQALDLSWSPDGRFISSRVTTFGGVSRLEVWEAA
jgi:hypothetical protein